MLDLVYQIPCHNCGAIFIGKMRCSVKTWKIEQASAVKDFDQKRSALCHHVLECHLVLDWKNVKILKFKPHVNRCCTVKSFR